MVNKIFVDNSFIIPIFKRNDTNQYYWKKQRNFIELDINKYSERVFSVFKKYNNNTYKASFIDCSCVVIAKKL